MFVRNDDLSIYATRGDVVFFGVSAKYKDMGFIEDDDSTNDGDINQDVTPGEGDDRYKGYYKFQPGDVVRIKIYEKKNAESVVLQKDFPITEETYEVEIMLTKKDTTIGEVISKPKDYWYEIELNPFSDPHTIIGYDEDGAKIFKLFPEGADVPAVKPTPEDIPFVDEELNVASTRPVQNQVIARAIVKLQADIETLNEAIKRVNRVLNL
jgi:hypothetical protein